MVCLFLCVWRERGNQLSIIDWLYQFLQSEGKNNNNEIEKKHSAELGPVCWNCFQPPALTARQVCEYSLTSGWTNEFARSNTFWKGAINCDYARKEKCCSPTRARWEILLCVIKTSTFNGLGTQSGCPGKARDVSRAFWTAVALFSSPLFFCVPRLEGAHEGTTGSVHRTEVRSWTPFLSPN